MKKILLGLISIILLLAIALGVEGITIKFENPLTKEKIEDVISGIIDFIFLVAIVLVPIIILFGAFSFLTSGGDPRKVDTAKKIILYSLIGLFIVIFAKGIVYLIREMLGV